VEKIINPQNWSELSKQFLNSEPYNYVVIDNFFNEEFVIGVSQDIPDYERIVVNYDNSIEKKKLCDRWHTFPKSIYTATFSLVCTKFVGYMRELTQQPSLEADYGLHGGGIHMHKPKSYLNVHLDYDIHPKVPVKRKLNLIVYLTPNWEENWNGGLEMWSHDPVNNQPKECIKKITPFFNRAVIFDTTQNSWHGVGVSDPINSPDGINRKSLAIYYVLPSDISTGRNRALFTPRPDQRGDESVLDLIEQRIIL